MNNKNMRKFNFSRSSQHEIYLKKNHNLLFYNNVVFNEKTRHAHLFACKLMCEHSREKIEYQILIPNFKISFIAQLYILSMILLFILLEICERPACSPLKSLTILIALYFHIMHARKKNRIEKLTRISYKMQLRSRF